MMSVCFTARFCIIRVWNVAFHFQIGYMLLRWDGQVFHVCVKIFFILCKKYKKLNEFFQRYDHKWTASFLTNHSVVWTCGVYYLVVSLRCVNFTSLHASTLRAELDWSLNRRKYDRDSFGLLKLSLYNKNVSDLCYTCVLSIQSLHWTHGQKLTKNLTFGGKVSTVHQTSCKPC